MKLKISPYPRITGLGLLIYGKHIERKRGIVKNVWKLLKKKLRKSPPKVVEIFIGGGGC